MSEPDTMAESPEPREQQCAQQGEKPAWHGNDTHEKVRKGGEAQSQPPARPPFSGVMWGTARGRAGDRHKVKDSPRAQLDSSFAGREPGGPLPLYGRSLGTFCPQKLQSSAVPEPAYWTVHYK